MERLLQPSQGDIPADFARHLLELQFTAEEHDRYVLLSSKSQDGTITPEELGQLEELVTADDVLTILQSKAELSLRHTPAA